MNSLYKNNIAKKSNLILIEPTLFQIGKKSMFLQLVKDPAYVFYVKLAYFLSVD